MQALQLVDKSLDKDLQIQDAMALSAEADRGYKQTTMRLEQLYIGSRHASPPTTKKWLKRILL
jgi:hypothetical protein